MSGIRATSISQITFRQGEPDAQRTQKLELMRRAVGAPTPAPSSATTFQAIAGEALSGNRAVFIADDAKVYLSTQASVTSLRTIGLTTGAVALGATATIQTEGVYTEPSWTWSGNRPVWLSTSGLLTQTPPSSGYLFQIGVPVGPTRLLVEPQFIAQLA